jgi:hypothetical protein
MKLSPSASSIHAKLYKSTYGVEELPSSLCAYFWADVLAFIFMLPSWPGHLLNILQKDYRVKSFWWFIHIILALPLGLLLIPKSQRKTAGFFHCYGLGMCILLGTVAVGVLIWFVGEVIKREREKKKYIQYYQLRYTKPNLLYHDVWNEINHVREQKEEGRKWLVVEWFKAFKGKYCPKLEWRE